ncbi:polyprenyl synthetase family protein [Kitasatospora sp. NPDC054939]
MEETGTLAASATETACLALERARALVAPQVRRVVDRLPAELRHVAGCHFGWWDVTGRPLDGAAGKGLRPALVLLCCEALGGPAAAGVAAAVAVELVHNASLLHDDIIDGDRTRRGRPAVWDVFGTAGGILAGDALFFLAVEVIAEAPEPLGRAGVRHLTATVQDLIGGEWTDTQLERRAAVSLEESAATAAGKTGSLFAAACGLGALAGAGGAERVERMREFGSHLGMAFQLTDDLLGIWGDPKRTGKPAWSDLAARKKSLPVAAALAADGPEAAELGRLYRARSAPSGTDLARMAALTEAAGGRAWAECQARRHTDLALAALAAADPEPAPAAGLTALAELILTRSH